jgi:predicted permease
MWARLRNRLRYLVSGRRINGDIARELEFHRDMLTEEERRLGRSEATAALNARRRMGNTTLMTEYSRDAWIVSWIDALDRDVRYAFRSFRRNPAFTTVALLTLALGIGANTAIFRVVDTVLLRTLPVRHPEELAGIRRTFSYWQYQQIRDRNDVFTASAGFRPMSSATLVSDGRPLGRTTTELVSGNYFTVLGVNPILGRAITEDDDRAVGSGPIAVISYGLWQRAFGASPSVLGRTIRVDDGAVGGGTSGFEPEPKLPPVPPVLTIVGVAPAGFFGESVGTIVDVWVPMTMQPILTPGRAWVTRRSAYWVNVIGRRRPGIPLEQAQARLTEVWRQIRLEEAGPKASEQTRRNLARAQLAVESAAKGTSDLRREFFQPLLILMTVVTLVLLIACLNVANLLLARATARRQEISMRLSLGASRSRLVRQLLTESLLLALAGGGLGIGVAIAGERILMAMVSGETRTIDLPLVPDWQILAFTIGVSIASGVVFGLLPALRGTRTDLQHTLKESSRGSTAMRGRTSQALVAVQIGVSLMLVVACGLFVRTLINLERENVGYDRGLLVVRMDPVGAGYRGDAIGRAVLALRDRLAAVPGVANVTFSENGLFSGTESGSSVEIEGFKPASEDDRNARFDQAGPGYFTGVGIPIVLGRDFTDRDGAGAPRVTVINETMARFYFGSQNPIGRHVGGVTPDKTPLEIVGVARDAQDHDLRDKPVRRFYVCYLQPIDGITTVNFEIRAAGDPARLAAAIREETRRFDPKLQIVSVRTAQALIDRDMETERLIARLSTVFGVLALLLAAIGLYGVMSYSVARRASEIGVRMALGATGGAVASMILREIVGLVAIGSLVGAAGALGLARFVESLMFGLAPRDPLTLAAAVGVLLAVGLLTGYLPARRAARIDPVVALRSE